MTTRDDALMLLRAAYEQAQGTVGEPVVPAQAALHAGLEQGSDRYNAALSLLLHDGALVEDERFEGVGAGPHENVVAFVLAERALDVLQEE
jgi:hypothetical protein